MMRQFRSLSAGPARPLAEPSLKQNPSPKRRKHHLAWEQAQLASHGLYGDYLKRIAERYPQLSPMELRVAALIKAGMPSWRIAELLGICESTVENHRVNIRRKIGPFNGSLMGHLAGI